MEKHEICKLIIQRIKDYIFSPDCLEAHRGKNSFIRKRKLSMLHLITYLLYTSKASMLSNISSIQEELGNEWFPNVSKQAVSKARQNIDPSLFRELFNISVDLFYSNIDKRKRWHGYHVFAIDGSKIEVPNGKSTFEFFGEMFTHPDPERKYTAGLASVVYDVLDDYIVHASLHRFLASERSAAIEHMKNLQALDIYTDSIIIFDRGYYSEEMFRYCVANGYFCLMRLKESIKLTRSCNGEKIDKLPGNKKKHIEDIPIRVIEVILDDGSKEYLATNIFDPSITREMFKELYFLRWPIELKYYELKERLLMEEYSGKTKTSVFQDFYINLLLANLTSLIKNKVDEDIDRNLNPANKYRYQANRTFIIGKMKKLLPKILCNIKDLICIDALVKDAFRARSQIQPRRKCKRKNRKLVCRKHFPNQKYTF